MNMDLGAIAARSDAPKGFYKEDNTTPNDVVVLESKQNSDAAGLLYQWGRKDPFTFATKNSGCPVKIYNAQGKEIVQTLNGTSDNNGGVTIITDKASSMLETVEKPNAFYATGGNTIIIQIDKTVYDYYWTSYSRGTDGNAANPNSDNTYLNKYNQKRLKSIFDPCPYGFRVPTNGTGNRFLINNPFWKLYSYIAGIKVGNSATTSWFSGLGYRAYSQGRFTSIGGTVMLYFSTVYDYVRAYSFGLYQTDNFMSNNHWTQPEGFFIRCIEDKIEVL